MEEVNEVVGKEEDEIKEVTEGEEVDMEKMKGVLGEERWRDGGGEGKKRNR